MNHIITHTHIHKYQFSNSTRKMLEDLSGGASMKRRGKRRRGEKEREEKKRGRKKNGRRKKKRDEEKNNLCSTGNRTQDLTYSRSKLQPLAIPQACEARTIILTYMANLNCHELRVASLAALAQPTNH